MNIKFNNYTVTIADLKAAKWERCDSGNATTWARDDYSHAILALPMGDDVWWDGIEASNIPAIDTADQPCKISISLDVCDDESTHIYINSTVEVGHAEDEDGESLYAYDLARIAGYHIGGQMQLDYDVAVDEFIADHPSARYIMHNHRGFANEWTLWVCLSDEEAEEAIAATNNWDEYNAQDVRTWLNNAMQTADDYKSNHGCGKYCSAMYWTDYDV